MLLKCYFEVLVLEYFYFLPLYTSFYISDFLSCTQNRFVFMPTFNMWHVNLWQNKTVLAQQLLYKVHHHMSLTWQVDEAIQPGLTSLNWTSLNIDKYLCHIDKALGKQKIQQAHCPTCWHIRHPATQHWQHLLKFTLITSLCTCCLCVCSHK